VSGLVVRPERPEDLASIDAVNERAFGRPDEAAIVRALRRDGALAVSLVAERGGRVLGHVAFSPVAIEGEAATRDALALGPVAVDPEAQRGGIGIALCEAGLRSCAARGARLAFVLGHPAYYPRFGFRPAAPAFRYRSAEFDRAFFALELAPGAAAGRSGLVRYHRAFDGA
jgi:putative acetyltransferase